VEVELEEAAFSDSPVACSQDLRRWLRKAYLSWAMMMNSGIPHSMLQLPQLMRLDRLADDPDAQSRRIYQQLQHI